MLKQIRYFQSVVRLGSFTAAAEEHFISQSAISQQIKALEEELGVTLLERKKRSFTLTPAGEFFYKKSLVLVADYDNMVRELQKVSGNHGELLKVGLLKGYSGKEFHSAVSEFTVQYPDTLQLEAICRMRRCLTVWQFKARRRRSSAPIHSSLFVTGLTGWVSDLKMKMKTAADILMTAALPVLMCYSIVGETAHEVIGIAMFGLFILHHILNFGWINSLFKGKYDLRRSVNTAVNALVFLCMVGLMYDTLRA